MSAHIILGLLLLQDDEISGWGDLNESRDTRMTLKSSITGSIDHVGLQLAVNVPENHINVCGQVGKLVREGLLVPQAEAKSDCKVQSVQQPAQNKVKNTVC